MKFLGAYDNSRLPIGFTPMTNKRIQAAVASAAMQLLRAGRCSPNQVHSQAVSLVARTLPHPGHARRYRLPRPSKSDSAAYRKQACAAG